MCLFNFAHTTRCYIPSRALATGPYERLCGLCIPVKLWTQLRRLSRFLGWKCLEPLSGTFHIFQPKPCTQLSNMFPCIHNIKIFTIVTWSTRETAKISRWYVILATCKYSLDQNWVLFSYPQGKIWHIFTSSAAVNTKSSIGSLSLLWYSHNGLPCPAK